MKRVLSLSISLVSAALLLTTLHSCSGGNSSSVTTAPIDTTTASAPELTQGNEGSFTLSTPVSTDAAGKVLLSVASDEALPTSLSVGEATFVQIPVAVVPGYTSYIATPETATTALDGITEIFLGVNRAEILFSVSAEAVSFIYQGDPTDVTFEDYILVRATGDLPPALRTAANIATRANELFPAGSFMAGDLQPVPNDINTEFAAGGSVPPPDLTDALVVYAATFLPPNLRTAENLAAVINALDPSANLSADDIVAIPGESLSGGVTLTPVVSSRPAGSFQISVQDAGVETASFTIENAAFVQLPLRVFPGFTTYVAEPSSSLLSIEFGQVDIEGVSDDDCIIVHEVGEDPLIAANQIATSDACGDAPFVRGVAVDLLEDVNAELIDVAPNGTQAVLVGSDDLTLIGISGDSLSELDGFDFDDLGVTPPTGFMGADFTGVDISPDGSFALVGVKEEDDATNGLILAVELPSLDILASVEVGVGPDSVAIAPNGLYAAVANEAEGDEENLPTAPPGSISILDLTDLGNGNLTETTQVDITGGPILFPDDPQPETVKINADSNTIIASLQENNGASLITVNGTDGNGVPNDFSVNNVDLGLRTVQGINVNGDVGEGECLSSNGYADALPPATFDSAREPDGIAITSDFPWFVTADEDNIGASFGNGGPGSPFGSRSISVFNLSGTLLGDSGNTIEESVVDLRLPMRCEDKGPEPEVVDTGVIGGRTLVFTSLERSDAITIHDITTPSNITLVDTVVLITDPSSPLYVVGNDEEAQLEPEGIVFIPSSNQLITANSENDSVSLVNLILN